MDFYCGPKAALIVGLGSLAEELTRHGYVDAAAAIQCIEAALKEYNRINDEEQERQDAEWVATHPQP